MADEATTNSEENIVIIGIGHSSLYENAQSQKLTNPALKAKAEADSGYNAKLNRVTEYRYCLGLAKMIVEELAKLGIKGLTANRYAGADLNGQSTGERDMGAEIRVINKAIVENNPKVKASIDLHLNAVDSPSATGFEIFCQDTEIGKSCAQLFLNKMKPVLNIRFRGIKAANANNANQAGMCFPRRVSCPALLLELFFVSNNSDLERGLDVKADLAKAIAEAFKDICDKKMPPFDLSSAMADARVQSSSLAGNKLQTTATDDSIKNIASETQQKLIPLEREMGEGGDKYSFYTKNAVEIIGTAPVSLPPVKIDVSGQVGARVALREGGTVKNQYVYPQFQAIDYASDMPTGKKNIIAHTQYEITTHSLGLYSSGDASLTSVGPLTIRSNYQTDVQAGYNINLEAGKVINITCEGDVNIEAGNTTVTGNMGVTGNELVSGIVYADGGLYSMSFNGPATIDNTNTQELYGYLAAEPPEITLQIMPGSSANIDGTPKSIDGTITVKLISATGGATHGNGAIVEIPPHKHYFKRLKGTLADSGIALQSQIASTANN